MGYGYGVECHFQHYSSYIVVVRFIGRGNRRKPLKIFITQCCIKYTSPFVVIELALLMVIGTISLVVVNPTTIRSRPQLPPVYIYILLSFSGRLLDMYGSNGFVFR